MEPAMRKKSVFVSKKKYQKLLERQQQLESKLRKLLGILYGFFKGEQQRRKPERPKTTVLCFFSGNRETSYHFHSEPDYERIRNEMIEDGGYGAIVIEETGKCSIICKNHLDPWGDNRETSFPRKNLKYYINHIQEYKD